MAKHIVERRTCDIDIQKYPYNGFLKPNSHTKPKIFIREKHIWFSYVLYTSFLHDKEELRAGMECRFEIFPKDGTCFYVEGVSLLFAAYRKDEWIKIFYVSLLALQECIAVTPSPESLGNFDLSLAHLDFRILAYSLYDVYVSSHN
jgi:hypothetical protein